MVDKQNTSPDPITRGSDPIHSTGHRPSTDVPEQMSRDNQVTDEARQTHSTNKKVNNRRFDTFEDFVAFAYSRGGREVKLPKQDAMHIAEQPTPEDTFFTETLPSLAAHDHLLSVPSQFFLAGLPYRHILRIWRQVERAYIAMLRLHPASTNLVETLQASRSSQKPAWNALETVCSANAVSNAVATGLKQRLRASDHSRLQHNLVCNVVLWLTQFSSVDLDSVIRQLYTLQWRNTIKPGCKSTDRLKTLFRLTDYSLAGLVASSFADETERQRRRAEDSESLQSGTSDELAHSQEVVRQLEVRVEELISRTTTLEMTIQKNNERHMADLAHAAHDHNEIISRMTRRIEAELDLLQEGLSALRRNPPKTHVMDDHAERAISGLRSELDRLLPEG